MPVGIGCIVSVRYINNNSRTVYSQAYRCDISCICIWRASFWVIFFYRLGDVLSLLLYRLDIFSSRLGKVCEEVRRRYPPIVSGYQTFGLPKMLKLHSFTVPEFPSPLVKSYIRSYIKNVKFLINHKILKKKKIKYIYILYTYICHTDSQFNIFIHHLVCCNCMSVCRYVSDRQLVDLPINIYQSFL